MSPERATFEAELKKDGFLIRPVVGKSMLPMLLEESDAIRLIPLTGRLKKYDIPLYLRPDGKYVLHRVLSPENGYYIIRGDNCKALEKVPDGWIIAVAEGFYRGETYTPLSDKSYIRYAHRKCRFWRIKSLMYKTARRVPAPIKRVLKKLLRK